MVWRSREGGIAGFKVIPPLAAVALLGWIKGTKAVAGVPTCTERLEGKTAATRSAKADAGCHKSIILRINHAILILDRRLRISDLLPFIFDWRGYKPFTGHPSFYDLRLRNADILPQSEITVFFIPTILHYYSTYIKMSKKWIPAGYLILPKSSLAFSRASDRAFTLCMACRWRPMGTPTGWVCVDDPLTERY